MHKTPGKWIKSILSGKRSSKSALSKKSANEEGTLVSGKLLVYSAENSPLTSHPATTVAGNELEPNSENRTVAEVPEKVVNLSGGKEAEDAQVASFFDSLDGPERIRHEQAARKVQAAFRGYLARRAFRALKGIIRLQAVIRGHLVRRQAVATLYCVLGIVRFQALVRGQKVRHTVTGVKVQGNSCLAVNLNANHSMTSALADKLSQNAFAQKLLASSPAAMPLRLQYGQEEANSSWKWLQCWTISHIWSVRSQRKINSESHLKNGSLHAVGSEQGRLKRDLQKPSAANREDCLTRSPSESEKLKHGTRKVSKCSVESIQGRPENEIQKVRHNLRRISNTSLVVSDRLETDVHKTKCAQRKVSTSVAIEASEVGGLDISESMKKDVAVIELKQLGEETSRKSLTAVEPVDKLCDQFQECDGIETNKGFISNDNQVSNEKPKSCKRRASLPGKQDNQENGLQVTPRLPSYMATTESAKAKLRGQTSPKVGHDETEKNGFTRRHSLPSSMNGKLNSLSPRVQKLVHSNGRGSLRSDKSLSSSRDEKAIQSEWRR